MHPRLSSPGDLETDALLRAKSGSQVEDDTGVQKGRTQLGAFTYKVQPNRNASRRRSTDAKTLPEP